MKILKPYRARIDALDKQLIDLFVERFQVIKEVGHLKARENIDAILQDRVDEVRNNAVTMADGEIDPAFIYRLWTDIIKYSCDLEEDIKTSYKDSKTA
jgi:chorismate mutase|tara:strand:- start:207 stop:500 length:294 start_codon:yes stop_codon:yes gene_type:complete